jgi:hypothetical protein
VVVIGVTLTFAGDGIPPKNEPANATGDWIWMAGFTCPVPGPTWFEVAPLVRISLILFEGKFGLGRSDDAAVCWRLSFWAKDAE